MLVRWRSQPRLVPKESGSYYLSIKPQSWSVPPITPLRVTMQWSFVPRAHGQVLGTGFWTRGCVRQDCLRPKWRSNAQALEASV